MEAIRQTPFFAMLPEADIGRVGSFFREKGFTEGETIFIAGEPATRLYVVAAGKVKLVRTTAGGKSIVLGIMAPGDFVGGLAALGDAAYPDAAVAHTDCCLLAVAPGDFQQILKLYPPVATAALEVVAARLRSMHELVEQLSAYTVEQRIASTLLGLAAKMGEKRGNAVLIQTPLSRQDLAEMTGTAPETVSRVMARLRQSGLVRTGRRWVAILDPPRLAAAASDPTNQH